MERLLSLVFRNSMWKGLLFGGLNIEMLKSFESMEPAEADISQSEDPKTEIAGIGHMNRT